MKGVESARRGRSVDENLAAWEGMKAGTPEGLATAMRFKMDMKVRMKLAEKDVF